MCILAMNSSVSDTQIVDNANGGILGRTNIESQMHGVLCRATTLPLFRRINGILNRISVCISERIQSFRWQIVVKFNI